jgi:NADH dehydrogenase
MTATVGRSRAVLESGRLKLDGFLAWAAWLVIHIWYLMGFRNRVAVMLNWAWNYLTYRQGARLITGGSEPARLEALTASAERRSPAKAVLPQPPREAQAGSERGARLPDSGMIYPR